MIDPFHILFVDTSPTPTRGGAQKSLLFILRHLDKKKFTPHVFMYVPHGIEDELNQLEISFTIQFPNCKPKKTTGNQPPEPTDYHGTWRDLAYRVKSLFTVEWKRYQTICKSIKQSNADLIYLNGNYTAAHGAIFAAKRFGLPLISHQRRLSVYTLLDRFLSSWIDCMIMYTSQYKDYIRQLGVNPQSDTVIYNALLFQDLPVYNPQIESNYKKEFGLDELIPVVCHIGTIHPIKGQEITLNAVMNAWRIDQPFYFLLIGEERNQNYVLSLKNLVKGEPIEPYIKFLGPRNDALSIVSICDISMDSTKAEAGFSRVVLESLCMGKTVIAPAAGCSEIIQNGVNGFLFSDEDVESCAASIQAALDCSREQIGKTAQEKARQLFDGQSVMSEIERTIHHTLQSHNPK